MIANLAAALLASLTLVQQSDTTFAVDAAGRLEVNQHEGTVVVTTWDRAEMRVHGDYDDEEAQLKIRSSGSEVRLEVTGEWGEPVWADLEITVPQAMAIEINGVSLEVSIQGAGGDVSVSSVEGGIEVSGGSGNVALNSVDGDVTVSGASGNMAINAVDGVVSLTDARGNIAVQAVDGDVALEGIESDHVEANSVDGDISYRGTINDGGRYFLSTHDGDLFVTIPDGTNARVSVATFSGELQADFPITMEGDVGKKRFSFTIGTGKALIELSAFDGTIQLVRP
jgi:DUF4097 and DUF4098 domain-containing protein YvlB